MSAKGKSAAPRFPEIPPEQVPETFTLRQGKTMLATGVIVLVAFGGTTAWSAVAGGELNMLGICVLSVLAGLVILGGVQAWWLEPVLTRLGDYAMVGATLLTAFNDNAAVTFLASTVPNLPEAVKYSVVAGAVTGGGLTVIANAPNPAGQAILGKYFKGINPLWLFAWAAFPTAIVFIFFTCFGH